MYWTNGPNICRQGDTLSLPVVRSSRYRRPARLLYGIAIVYGVPTFPIFYSFCAILCRRGLSHDYGDDGTRWLLSNTPVSPGGEGTGNGVGSRMLSSGVWSAPLHASQRDVYSAGCVSGVHEEGVKARAGWVFF